MMRRFLTLPLAATLLLGAAGVASADDVTEMIEEAAAAEFHGTGIVMCSWGADSAAASYEVTRAAGMSMVVGPEGTTMSHAGVSAVRSGSDWYGTEVEEWAAWSVNSRYTVGESLETTHLGRPALLVTVLEEGRPRARMVLDAESTVPLLTEILDADGKVYRIAALTTFSPGKPEMPDEMPEVQVMDTVRPMAASTSLPASIAGYVRADTYDAGGGAIHAFYTDGLFSFSVFEAERGGPPAAFEGATEFERGDHRYRRLLTPTSVWVHWNAPDRSYVLVGDLPPDHVLAVLDRLPAPGQRSIFVRIWRALFG